MHWLKDEKGYTLLESLFQLAIMAIFLQFVVLFYFWKAPIENQLQDYSSVEWELFAIDLQSYIADVKEFHITKEGRAIYFIIDRGEIEIGQSGSVIRKTVFGMGHIPLYTNVRSVHFSRSGEFLNVQVTMTDGQVRERGFVIGIYPE